MMSRNMALRKGLRSKSLWSALLGMLLISGLSAYALYGLFRADTTGLAFSQLIERIGLRMFVVSGLIYMLDLALALLGWGWIIGTLSRLWDWGQHFRIYCITAITRRLPGTMWYMVGRVVMYEQLQVPRAQTLVGSGLEFAMTIVGGLVLAIVTWPIALSGQTIHPIWFIGGLLLSAILLNPPFLRALMRRLSPRSGALDLRYRHLIGWVLLYALVWLVGGGILFVLATTIHPLPISTLPAVIGIWAASGFVSLVFSFIPFGLGVQELALSALLTPYMGSHEAIITALLMRGVLTINEALWALIAGLLWLVGVIRPTGEHLNRSDTSTGTRTHSDGQHAEEW